MAARPQRRSNGSERHRQADFEGDADADADADEWPNLKAQIGEAGDSDALMGAAASASRLVLAGNDCAGKTWLLTRAKLATTAQATAHRLPGRTISTIGVSHEHVRPVAAHPHLEVLDVGGGCRSGLLFVNAATTADGLVFVLRATDARLYSALWELYAVGASSQHHRPPAPPSTPRVHALASTDPPTPTIPPPPSNSGGPRPALARLRSHHRRHGAAAVDRAACGAGDRAGGRDVAAHRRLRRARGAAARRH